MSLLVSLGMMVACGRQPTTPDLFIPPTPASQATPLSIGASEPIPASPTEPPPPTPTPPCSPDLTFLEDLTIPDGTIAAPGETLDKRWRVQNSGSCNWEFNYSVILIGGLDMGAPAEQALFPARSGTEVVIRMIFTAPTEPGTYSSAWQARDPTGNLFGDPFFIAIVVP
jgi:hypothetical protein